MEYLWILFALWAMMASWLGSFVKKLALLKQVDKDVFMFTSFCFYVSFFFLNMLFQGDQNFHTVIVLPWILLWVLNAIISFGSLTALKYLNISFALISMRLIASFLLLLIGVLVVWEQLSLYNYFWFFMWAVAIFLLSWYKLWQKLNLHWKGLIGLILVIIWNVWSHTWYKYLLPNVNVHDYMFVQYLVAFICILLYMWIRKQYTNINIIEMKKCIPFSAINLCLYGAMFLYFLPNLYTFGTLSLGYKILSYSLIIPILLSIIFLWEPINRTRMIAFGLTIVSIFLFLI